MNSSNKSFSTECFLQVANLVCQMSNNEEGIKMIKYAAMQVEKLAPQVVNAARLLCARADSKVAQENMAAFRETWEEKVIFLAFIHAALSNSFLRPSPYNLLEPAFQNSINIHYRRIFIY
jgi:catenin alpha